MKINFLALMLFSTIILLGACNNSSDNLLIGFWKLDKIESDKKSSPEEQKILDQVYAELINNSNIKFNSDQSYEQVANGNASKGKWQIVSNEDDENVLVKLVDADSGEATILTIGKLTSSEMVMILKSEDYTTKNTFLKK